MSGIVVDLDAARKELRALTPRTVALLAAMRDPSVPMSGSEWTVGEAAAHLVIGAVDYSEHAGGMQQCYRIDPADKAGSHCHALATMMKEGGHKRGAELQQGINAFLDSTEGRTAEDLLPWHLHAQPCATMTCLLIGEQLLHGYDMAQALGAEWRIEPEPARLAIAALLSLMPLFVDSEAAKDVDVTYELAVDGGPRVLAHFHNDTVSVKPSENRSAHCHLSGDPVSWLLALYGRASWEEVLRTGRVQVTDGDAALGAGFKRLIRNP